MRDTKHQHDPAFVSIGYVTLHLQTTPESQGRTMSKASFPLTRVQVTLGEPVLGAVAQRPGCFHLLTLSS